MHYLGYMVSTGRTAAGNDKVELVHREKLKFLTLIQCSFQKNQKETLLEWCWNKRTKQFYFLSHKYQNK